MRRASLERMSSWSHRALAPIAAAWRATSGASAEGRNTSTRSTGSGTSSSVRYTRSPKSSSANGLMGMMRKPRRCSPAGTDPAALRGSREAPTTAMVRALRRISSGLLPFTLLCTNAGNPARIPRDCAQTRFLGRFGLGPLRGLERDLEHVVDLARQVERHRVAHALGHVVQVLLVALREDDLLQAHTVSGQHLLLDAADGQDQALQRDLAGHADRAPHGTPGEKRHDSGRHRHAR